MSYARRLTMALRARGASEEMIADVLRTTAGRGLDDAELRQELGRPEEYADALVPGPRKARKAGPVLYAGVLAGAAWLMVAMFGPAVGWDVRAGLGPLALWPAVGLLVLGVLGQLAADYFRAPPR
ncbi:hypothetical protein [Puerhibacterium puerhi]|uniref:hypothetical protein n=1 Tax=Puerhibacterium puerhi TaxID=2692623 RepID=UPI00135B7605|nr:hypothetical protein [Puerhibacterium puerhi]